MQTFDLEAQGLRALNAALHAQAETLSQANWEVVNAKGSHAIAVGLDAPIEVTVKGSTGYYCAGMNSQATAKPTTVITAAFIKNPAVPTGRSPPSSPMCLPAPMANSSGMDR